MGSSTICDSRCSVQKLLRRWIISFSSVGHCLAGEHSGHDVCGKLKSPPMMMSGVASKLFMADESCDIALVKCAFVDGLPCSKSSG